MAILYRKEAQMQTFRIFIRYIKILFLSNFDVCFSVEWIVLRAFSSMSTDFLCRLRFPVLDINSAEKCQFPKLNTNCNE